MLGRLATIALLAGAFAAPAAAQPLDLLPGVTYEKTVEFTPHGAVVLHVLTAPRPTGLYSLETTLAGGTVTGGLARVTQLEQALAPETTCVGIEGDRFDVKTSAPNGIVLTGGVLAHAPVSTRSSIGIDASGVLHVDRVRFFGTWQGGGQRRPLDGLNRLPTPGDVVLYTPAYGPAAPVAPGSADVILGSLPPTAPNTDLTATVTATGSGGGEAIPAGGAILLATGSAAPKLQAEAPAGSQVALRLILQPGWAGVVDALGGGPVLVHGGKPVFHSLEDFTSDQVTPRDPRAAVGQLADGRIIMLAVDGRQPGYSIGLTTFELAQALTERGAVTASALDSGGAVTMAFDGTLLNRPSDPGGERAVKEALLLRYDGVYAPAPPQPLLNGTPARSSEQLSYKIVRPSTVTAQLVAPDGTVHVVEQAVKHDPGTYTFPFTSFDVEGAWRWDVAATDDLGRPSSTERTFRYDTTLQAVTVPATSRGGAQISVSLARPATVATRIETPAGVVVALLPGRALQAGTSTLAWNGVLATRTRAPTGRYVAHVLATGEVGTSDLSVSFAFRRVSP